MKDRPLPLPAILSALMVIAMVLVFLAPSGSTDEPHGADISSGEHQLHVIAYAVPKVGFDEIIPAFRNTPEGQDVGFAQSYGASGDQSRKVVRHVPADVVNFSVEPDITRLVKAGFVDEDWKSAVPNDPSGKSVPFGSVVSFVTREGNPKNIHTWDDLLRGDVEVISPNPASSGSAKWNLLAPYAYWFFQKLDQGSSHVEANAFAEQKVAELIKETFVVRPKSGREATSTFEQGQGDVLLSYENEAILLARNGAKLDYFNPPQTFMIENPVAVVNTSDNLQQAEAFRDYLFTEPAQTLWAKEGFRPAEDLYGQNRSVIDSLPAEDRDMFRPYEVAHSIDELAQAFAELAKESPELAQTHQLIKDGELLTGWAMVDAFLFTNAKPGSGDTDGIITSIYKKA